MRYNQSLAVADKVSFRNCLVSMRPSATKTDLPSTHNVTVYLHNAFATFLKKIQEEIKVIQHCIVALSLTH